MECVCFDLPECAAMMPTTTPASTTTTEPVPTTTGEADKRLEELKDDANRFRGQFDKNSFSILSQRVDSNFISEDSKKFEFWNFHSMYS